MFLRREDKNRWERRAPLTPAHVERLVREHGIEFAVEPSPIRVFPEGQYAAAGARISAEAAGSAVVLGVKEVPPAKLVPRTTYMFFAHVVKGQPCNMPMLHRLMDLGCTLVDFERIADAQGRRLIFFGRHAGLAGGIDTLWALGRRLAWRNLGTPLEGIRQAVDYPGLDGAKEAVARAGRRIREQGLPEGIGPVLVGVAGYGNTAAGVCEILDLLPLREIDPSEVAEVVARFSAERRVVFRTVFREEHTVAPVDPGARFDLEHFRSNPDRYRSRFGEVWPRLTALVNCTYWEPGFPRLLTREEMRARYGGSRRPRLEVIGDVSCDIEGSIECTIRVTTPEAPVYVYDPARDEAVPGVAGPGPVILAVDNLPCEMPVEASKDFGDALMPFIPAVARCCWEAPFEDLALPPELLRAVIVHRGELTPPYRYLRDRLTA